MKNRVSRLLQGVRERDRGVYQRTVKKILPQKVDRGPMQEDRHRGDSQRKDTNSIERSQRATRRTEYTTKALIAGPIKMEIS